MNKNNNYFQTKSKVFAYAIQYITNQNFYKFQNNDTETVYSFEKSDGFDEKINKLNDIKFS
jgi:hypothetical protein